MISMVGLWDDYYKIEREYGDSRTYEIAADWLKGYGLVEDWGCGTCWSKRLKLYEEYRGVDGSGHFADIRADLREYRSRVPCILMRHVLEHNLDWRKILDNALHSFQRRMVLLLFMHPEENERILYWQDGIPYIFLPQKELDEMLRPYLSETKTEGNEICFLLEK